MTHQPGILVVEDDDTIRESVVEFLEDEGYVALGAIHGRDALSKLATAWPLPTLIILDLMMPVMDGRTFRREQQQVPKLASIPVVVLSALVDAGHQASEMGAAGHLKKPFALKDLLSLVQIYCGGPWPIAGP